MTHTALHTADFNFNVYVGTYGKYNGGSIFGKWMNLADYEDKDEFYAACKKLHSDEEDPEFMFQDWENIPSGLISESSLSENVFGLAHLMNEMTDDEINAFLVWCEMESINMRDEEDAEELIERFRDAYQGEYDSEVDFAQQYADENLNLEGPLAMYFDYAAYARDLFITDFYFANGYVFNKY